MRSSLAALFACAVVCSPSGVATADPWKDESGHGRWRGEYQDGHRGSYVARDIGGFRYRGCKIERKWERNGYEVEIKCEGLR